MKRLILILIIALSAPSLFAAGMNLPNIGALAMAMGGAYRAVAGDGTAIYWNPAGLSGQNSSAEILGQFLFTRSSYTAADTLRQLNSLFREEERENLDPRFVLGNFYLVYSPDNSGRWSFGLGGYTPTGVGTRWNVMEDRTSDNVTTVNPREMNPVYPDSDFAVGITEPLPDTDFRARIGTFTLSPSAAFRTSEKLSFGIAPTVTYAMLKGDIPSSDPERMEADTGIILQQIDMTGWSGGAVFGGMYRPRENLCFGLSARLESRYYFRGDYEETVFKFYNEYLASLGAIFGDTVLTGGVLKKPVVDGRAELQRPQELGFGAAYLPSPDWTLSADIAWVTWSAVDTIELLSTDDERLEALPMHWEDTYRLSAGAEYRGKGYALRLGLFYEQIGRASCRERGCVGV